jgi:lipopolysaccharide export system protein LptA
MLRFIQMVMVLLALGLYASDSGFAQTPAQNVNPQEMTQSAEDPIEITALKSVEWLRDQRQYVAREDVVVTQGALTIRTDLLTADYKEGNQSSMQIYKLTATGNVRIESDGNIATGDEAVYDVETGLAVLTGKDLKITSPEQVVTAKERMEYAPQTRIAKAIGDALVIRGEDRLAAQTITAVFKDKSSSSATQSAQMGNLERLEAQGSVVITTPQEVLKGSKGIYSAATNKAELMGNVTITRGPNVLEGERAEIDLTTNVSRMFASDSQGGRVRGVFYPGSAPRQSP